jgi:hypothetical protein
VCVSGHETTKHTVFVKTHMRFSKSRQVRSELPEPIDITLKGAPVFRSSDINKLSGPQLVNFRRTYGNGYILLRDTFVEKEPDAVERLIRTGERDKPTASHYLTTEQHGKYLRASKLVDLEHVETPKEGFSGLVLVLETSSSAGADAEAKTCQEKQSSQSAKKTGKPKATKVKGTVTPF